MFVSQTTTPSCMDLSSNIMCQSIQTAIVEVDKTIQCTYIFYLIYFLKFNAVDARDFATDLLNMVVSARRINIRNLPVRVLIDSLAVEMLLMK